jgi:AcrR family transcriptional regulator
MGKYANSDSTKVHLINAAGELAAELGFSNVSTRAVGELSGENIGSIHYHFGGKEGLFEAVVNEAIIDIKNFSTWKVIDSIDEKNASPEQLSSVIRKIVHQRICTLFDPQKPRWHSQVIYQLLQIEGPLYELFAREVMNPDMEAMQKFFRIINPEMPDDEMVLHTLILDMPIIAHANYMPTILKLLNASSYSDDYLKKMENLLVRQTQLLFGLPLTESEVVKKNKKS